MRIATWNVNSIKARLPRLLEWLELARPDVACLQETKCDDAGFPRAEIEALGYETAHHGQGRWNGVALLSRVGLDDVRPGLTGAPTPEARAISATCDGVRVWSVYVPNGRTLDAPQYQEKLVWLESLRAVLPGEGDALLVAGDFNVAPSDCDVWDAAAFEGATHVTPSERSAVAGLGLVDLTRRRWPEPERVYTYWDYRAGMFQKDLGMRIDLTLATPAVADRLAATWVDRQARKGKGPSDHAPVIVDLDEARNGDIGPTIPPASVRRAG